VSLTSGRR